VASLREVASRAGVSLATASRVASGVDGVRPETRARVEGAMRDLLYVPPGRNSATGAIGLLVPELANPIFPALAQAMEARATEAGLATILCNTRAAAFREADYVHMLLDRRVDGMIFIACEMTHLGGEHEHYARLLDEGARLVFVNGALEGLDVACVSVDERHAGLLATRHLIALGHTRIGFVAGPDDYLPTRLKAAGRLEALENERLSADGLVVHGEFTLEGGRGSARALLERPDRPTAVICSSDVIAIAVLQVARELGLRVPADLSVVGFDDTATAVSTVPPLTTVHQPMEAKGEAAARLLLDGALATDLVLPTELIVRGSTGPPPV
jgi:DNA-binding LacI/PurR family transcriptional regulator